MQENSHYQIDSLNVSNAASIALYDFLDLNFISVKWCRVPESNWPPDDYKSTALPNELTRHLKKPFTIKLKIRQVIYNLNTRNIRNSIPFSFFINLI